MAEDDPWKPYEELIESSALEAELDPVMIIAILRTENSLADPLAIGPRGEIGCAQFKKSTWRWLARTYDLEGWNMRSCRDSILAAVIYLKYLEARCLKKGVAHGEGLWDCIIVSYHYGEGNLFSKWTRRVGEFTWNAIKLVLPVGVQTYRNRVWANAAN